MPLMAGQSAELYISLSYLVKDCLFTVSAGRRRTVPAAGERNGRVHHARCMTMFWCPLGVRRVYGLPAGLTLSQ